MKRSRRRAGAQAVVPLGALLGALAACGPPKPPEAGPGTSTVAPTAGDTPVGAAKPKVAEAGDPIKELVFSGLKVRVEACPFDVAPTRAGNDAIKGIARANDKLYVADGTKELSVYTIGAGCKLSLDRSAGQSGKVTIDGNVDVVRADDKGTVTASTGVFDAYRVRDGKVVGKCATNWLAPSPDGTLAFTSFANGTVRKVAITGDTCAVSDWVLQNLSDDAKRQGAFTNVNAIGFAGPLVLVGGIVASPKDARMVVAYDVAGTEKLRFGGKALAEDGFGWVHAVTGCGAGFCVADANFQTISLWKSSGAFVGRVSLKDLLGPGLPWAETLATTEDGSLLVGVTLRPSGAGPTVGKVLRLVFGGAS